ncbi:MAG TPA: hypothetical protein VHP31_12145 [Caproicibacter sp.]|nr:hypothetical protein [Caproicibacter sp.]
MSEIQKAIETLSDFGKQVTVKADGAYEKTDFIEAKKLAITTLKEQAEREKGCKYCNGLAHGGNADGETLRELETRARITHGNFCPNCGRDLRKPVQK